jgi:hypothetical protein
VSGLYFDSTVTRRIKYQHPNNGIYADLDGSLTGLGPNTWATPYWKHNDQPECQLSSTTHDGLICDSTIEVRRIAVHDATPSGIFRMMPFKIARYDDNVLADHLAATGENRTEYLKHESHFSSTPSLKAKFNSPS